MHRKVLTVIVTLALTLTLFTVFPVQALTPNPPDQYGPRLDKYRVTYIPAVDVQYSSLIAHDLDVLSPIVSPDLIADAVGAGKIVTYEPLYHYFRYMFNIHRGLYDREYCGGVGIDGQGPITNQRKYHPIADVNFRHALAHCLPRTYIVNNIFKVVYVPCATPVCDAYGEWQNPKVDDHPYNPGNPITSPAGEHSAAGILKAAGYVYDPTWGGGVGNWICPGDYDQDGTPGTTGGAITDPDDFVQSAGGKLTPAPKMVLYQTPRTTSPTENDAGLAYVAGMNTAGLNNVVLEEMDSSTKGRYTYDLWDYDIAWHISSWRVDIGWLPSRYHTNTNYRKSYNCLGMWWDAAGGLDTQLDIALSAALHKDAVAACHEFQRLIRGGTIDVPLPIPAPTNDDWWNWSVPEVIVGSRIGYVATQPELKGLVKYKGTGVSNEWSRVCAYWDTADGNRPAGPATVSDKSVYWLVRGVAECVNPLSYTSDYAEAFVARVIDSLIVRNPYTLQDEPKMAEAWGTLYWTAPGNKPGTMYWYQLRSGLTWQDGHAYTVEDAKFNFEFCKYWKIGKLWTDLQFLDHVNINPANRTVSVFLKGWKSIYLLHQYSGMAALIPPQIWDRSWASLSAIMGYAPETKAYGSDMGNGGWSGGQYGPYTPGTMPAGANNLFGTGEWILTGISSTYAWATYDANRNYWRKIQELYDRLGYLFWRVGDTNKDEIVDMGDITSMGYSFYTFPGSLRWNADCDVTGPSYTPPDLRIDFWDVSTAGKYNGDTKFVPYP